VLLAKLLGKGSEPLRFIDFSAPVRDADGAVRGVVAIHVHWDWVQAQLQSLSSPDIELALVALNRNVLFGPQDLIGRRLLIGAAVVASQGRALTRAEQWPDGTLYMTSIVPTIQYRDMRSFGWSVIIRQNLGSALAPMRELVRQFWRILSIGAAISLALLYLVIRWLATPLRRLTAFTVGLAAGDLSSPPHEETRYAEASDLSAALVRVQTRLMASERNMAAEEHAAR
jgi:HAMP domain-containing protein